MGLRRFFIDRLNREIPLLETRIAEREGIYVVPLGDLWQKAAPELVSWDKLTESWYCDSLHPNKWGAHFIGREAYRGVLKVLGSKPISLSSFAEGHLLANKKLNSTT